MTTVIKLPADAIDKFHNLIGAHKEYVTSFLLDYDEPNLVVDKETFNSYIHHSGAVVATYAFKQKHDEFDLVLGYIGGRPREEFSEELFSSVQFISLIYTFLRLEHFEILYHDNHVNFDKKFNRLKNRVEVAIFRECANFYNTVETL